MFTVYIEHSWYDLKMFTLCVCCGDSLLIKFFCRHNITGWVVHHCFTCMYFQINCSFKIFSSNLSSLSFRITWDLFLQNQFDYVRTEVSVTSVLLYCLWFMLRYNEYHVRVIKSLTVLNLLNRSLKAQSGFTIHSIFGLPSAILPFFGAYVTRWQRTRGCGQAALQQCSLGFCLVACCLCVLVWWFFSHQELFSWLFSLYSKSVASS